ncbi:MAG: TolC family protein [Acidobacteria bacterium]|nr:TolC family protein [Acidobacteriota bacterium]
MKTKLKLRIADCGLRISAAITLSVFLLALCLVTNVLAQDNPQSATRNPQSSDKRVGVDSTKRVTLTLRDAILSALENNRDVEVERLNVQLTEFDVRAADGIYDPTFTTSFFYDRRKAPVASILAGGQDGGLLTDNLTGNATLSQRLRQHGGLLQGTFNNDRATTQNQFNSLNPQFTSTLNVSFTQPLMKNRDTDPARRQIKLAKKRLDISDSQFRQRAIEIIAQVQRSYWDLVFARRDREIKSESVELARTQLEHNQRLVEAGTLAPADIISARVELERRNDEAEAAIDAIQRAENALKALMLQPDKAEMWNSELVPVEQPQIDSNVGLPLEDATRLALQNRPEMEQFRMRGELNKIDSEFFRDQTKPQVDFFISYGAIGLAGKERTEGNFFTASGAATTDRINQLIRFANGQANPPNPLIQLLPASTNVPIPGFLIGGNGQSLGNLFKNEFRTWRVGVNISLPIGNRTAEANLGRSLAEARQIDIQRQRTEQLIQVEVRNSLQAVETAKRRVEAAKNSRNNAELQYQSEQRKFDAGQSTSFFVLDRQNALSAARGRELRALTDYTKAAAELQRALSTTLSSNNVSVK